MRGMKTITSLFLLLFVSTIAAGKPTNYVKRESQQDPGFFTLIVLPDTQGYADVRHKETQKHWDLIALTSRRAGGGFRDVAAENLRRPSVQLRNISL